MADLLEKTKGLSHLDVHKPSDRAEVPTDRFVFPDERTFPIKGPGSVKDAVSSWGRYGGKHSFDDFKSRLTALTHRLGPEYVAELPDEWIAKKGSVRQTMHEFKHGELHSGSKAGPKVTSRRQAIAIALSQAAKAHLKTKAQAGANYHAHAGESIIGNLTRGANGKFASGGGQNAAKKPVSASEYASAEKLGAKIIGQGQPKDKPYKTLKPAKGGGKGGKKGGGKGKAPPKPKKTPAPKMPKTPTHSAKLAGHLAKLVAAHQAKTGAPKARHLKPPAKPKKTPAGHAAKPSPQDKKLAAIQMRNTTLAKFLTGGLDKALTSFADNPQAQLKPNEVQGLTKAGLLIKDTAGQYRLTNEANAVLSAATKGDERATKDALSKALDVANKRAAQVAKPVVKPVGGKKKETVREPGLFIFKQANGQYRWVTFSSSAFEDRDEETVALKALQDDVVRADLDGDYGPLLWWHLPEAVLGQCDYNTMIGRILTESGTFKSARIAEAMMKLAEKLGVSIGFFPRMEGKVYKAIHRKERSLLPEPVASNLLTKLFVRKNKMAKLDILRQLFGGGQAADELVNEIVQEATTKEQSALDMGLVHKAAAALNAPMDGTVMGAQPAPNGEKPKEPPVKKDDGMVAEGGEPLAPEMEEGGEEENPAEEIPGEDQIDAIVEALHGSLSGLIIQTIQTALEPLAQTLASAPAPTATKEVQVIALTLKEVVDAMGRFSKDITTLKEQVALLNQDQPPVVANMMRASQNPASKVGKDDPVLKQVGANNEDSRVDPYALTVNSMLANFGPFGPVQQGQQQ